MLDEIEELLQKDLFQTTAAAELLNLEEGERREVSILFADIKGFTSISENLDSEELKTVLDKLFQLFTLCIKHYGGYVDKYEGDLIMALFGAKIASESDTERAINAALEMIDKLKKFNKILSRNDEFQDIELYIRIGINTGLVTTGKIGEKREGDFTVYGDPVNIASRLEERTPLNRIMITSKTKKLVENKFDFENHGEIKLKGKKKSVSVYLIKGKLDHQFSEIRIRKSPFVGREKEIEVLNKKYNSYRESLQKEQPLKKPMVIGLKGQAGIGKSRLIYEFVNSLGDQSYLYGSTPSLTQNPYCIFSSMLRRFFKIDSMDDETEIRDKFEGELKKITKNTEDIFNDLEFEDNKNILGFLIGLLLNEIKEKLLPKEFQIKVQNSIKYFLNIAASKANGRDMPLIILVEDIQWSDESSIKSFQFLLQSLNTEFQNDDFSKKYLLFIFTYRDSYKIPRAIKEFSDFDEINIQPLDKISTDQLITSFFDTSEFPVDVKKQLIEKSEGNPFYIEEWVNLIKELKKTDNLTNIPIPSNLRALILSRIDNLDEEEKMILQKASVIGEEFLTLLLIEMKNTLNTTEDVQNCLDFLTNSDFIFKLDNKNLDSYVFKHILTQKVSYQTLLKKNRKVLHKIIAQIIEDKFSKRIEEFYYDLAFHFFNANERSKAIEYLEKAGDKAKKNYENIKALEFYNKLSDLILNKTKKTILNEDRRIKYLQIIIKQIDILLIIGEIKTAEALLKKAFDILNEEKDIKISAKLHLQYGRHDWIKGLYKTSMSHFHKSLKLYEKANDKEQLVYVFINITGIHWRLKEYNKAMNCLDYGYKIALETKNQTSIASILGNKGLIYLEQMEYDRAMELFEKNMRISEQLNNKSSLMRANNNIGLIYYLKKEYSKALKYFKNSLKLAREVGNIRLTSIFYGNIGDIHFAKGKFKAALIMYKKQLSISIKIDSVFHIGLSYENLAKAYCCISDYDKSFELYNRRIKISEKMGEKHGIANSYKGLGNLYFCQEKYKKAESYYDIALKIFEEIGSKLSIIALYMDKIDLYSKKGDIDKLRMYRKKLKYIEKNKKISQPG